MLYKVIVEIAHHNHHSATVFFRDSVTSKRMRVADYNPNSKDSIIYRNAEIAYYVQDMGLKLIYPE